MNCCDYDCIRAPGCPAGSACHSQPGCKDLDCPGHPAKVARIGRRDYDREALPASTWRHQLGHLARAMLVVIGTMVLVAIITMGSLA